MAATETQQGIAKIFAMDGANTETLAGAATITHESAGLSQNYDLMEDKGQNGEVETLIASNEHYDADIEFAPNGTTRTLAIAAAAKMKAGLIAKVVLSGFSVAAYNGNYNALPGMTWRLTKDGKVIMTLKLRRYIINNTTLTGGVIVG
jgi:hypothetical protein